MGNCRGNFLILIKTEKRKIIRTGIRIIADLFKQSQTFHPAAVIIQIQTIIGITKLKILSLVFDGILGGYPFRIPFSSAHYKGRRGVF